MIPDRSRERFSVVSLIVEIISTFVTFSIFFLFKLVKYPAYSDEPITLFQWTVYLIQEIVSTTK